MMGVRLYRILWAITWSVLSRPIPQKTGSRWKAFLLRLFGAKIGYNCDIYSSTTILYPRNLIVEDNVCIGPHTFLQNTAKIILKSNSIISQGTYLCTGSHDITSTSFSNIRKPIVIGSHAWIAAQCFVGPGVNVGEGAVCGARAAVFKDVAPWTVVGGNPAKFIKTREIKDA